MSGPWNQSTVEDIIQYYDNGHGVRYWFAPLVLSTRMLAVWPKHTSVWGMRCVEYPETFARTLTEKWPIWCALTKPERKELKDAIRKSKPTERFARIARIARARMTTAVKKSDSDNESAALELSEEDDSSADEGRSADR